MSEWVEWSMEIVNKINREQLPYMIRCKPELLTESQRKRCKNKTYPHSFHENIRYFTRKVSTMQFLFTGVHLNPFAHTYWRYFNNRYLVRLMKGN